MLQFRTISYQNGYKRPIKISKQLWMSLSKHFKLFDLLAIVVASIRTYKITIYIFNREILYSRQPPKNLSFPQIWTIGYFRSQRLNGGAYIV